MTIGAELKDNIIPCEISPRKITRQGVKCAQKDVNNVLFYGPLVSFTNSTFYNSAMKQLD